MKTATTANVYEHKAVMLVAHKYASSVEALLLVDKATHGASLAELRKIVKELPASKVLHLREFTGTCVDVFLKIERVLYECSVSRV